MPYYAVAKGIQPGIYTNWNEVRPLVNGYKGAVYKSFRDRKSAEVFMKNGSYSKGSKVSGSKVKKAISPKLAIQSKPDSSILESFTKDIITTISIPSPSCLIGHKIIFTDGGSRNNGAHDAKAGYGIFISPNTSNFSVSWDDCNESNVRPTNQTLELLAVRHALNLIEYHIKTQGPDKFIIKTDSSYSIKCLTEFGPSWSRNQWKKKDGSIPIHKDIVKECLEVLERVRAYIEFEHVRGHQGIYGNEMADILANKACDRAR